MTMTESPPDFKKTPKILREVPWYAKLFLELASPFYGIWMALSQLHFAFYKKNPFQNNDTIKNPRKIYAVEHISLSKLKVQSKKNKATVNEFIMAVLATAIKEYFVRHGDDKTKEIVMCSTFSLRDNPRKIEDVKIVNEFVAQRYLMPIGHDIT